MFRKLYALFRLTIMTAIQFRAETFLWMLIDIIPPITMIFIWKAIYSGDNILRGYTLNQVIQYYMLVSILYRFAESHFEEYRSQQIREGKVDIYLVKPLSFPLMILISHISNKFLSAFIYAPTLLLFLAVVKSVIPDFAFSLQFSALLPFLFLFAISFLVQYMIGLWITYATFWLEGSNGLEHFKWFFVALFGGTLMPLPFLPAWLQDLIMASPFKYLYAIPIAVLDGSYAMTLFDYLYALAAAVAMWLISSFIYDKARLHYASAGG